MRESQLNACCRYRDFDRFGVPSICGLSSVLKPSPFAVPVDRAGASPSGASSAGKRTKPHPENRYPCIRPLQALEEATRSVQLMPVACVGGDRLSFAHELDLRGPPAGRAYLLNTGAANAFRKPLPSRSSLSTSLRVSRIASPPTRIIASSVPGRAARCGLLRLPGPTALEVINLDVCHICIAPP